MGRSGPKVSIQLIVKLYYYIRFMARITQGATRSESRPAPFYPRRLLRSRINLRLRHHAVLQHVRLNVGLRAAVPDQHVGLAFGVRPGVHLVFAGRQAGEHNVAVFSNQHVAVSRRRRQLGIGHEDRREAAAVVAARVSTSTPAFTQSSVLCLSP